MSRPSGSLAAFAAVRIYALILALYPAEFRERCGQAMLAAFADGCRAAKARGTWWFMRECAAEYANAAAGVWRSRRPREKVSRLEERPGGRALAAFAQDAGYALRRLRAQPSIVFFTALTLGFGIAATAAIFSIVDAVLLRPSPFHDADRLFNVMNVASRGGFIHPGLSREKLRHWRTETDIFEAVEAYRQQSVLVTGGLEPEEVPAAQLSPGLLATFGVTPRIGRIFTPGEARAGQNAVVVVGERFWRSRLGEDRSVVGRSLTINGRPHTVVGVMPDRFHFPSLREQVWLPLDLEARPAQGEQGASMVARVKAGASREVVQARIAAAVHRLERDRPLPSGWNIVLRQGMLAGSDEETRRAVWILFGAVGLVLLTACANVANLLLSRAMNRQREFAIRVVLGATRGRMFRELIVEGLLLGLAAGIVGLVAANWAIESLVRLAPESLMYATTTRIAVDARVMVFGLTLAVLTGVICNLPPAFRALRNQSSQALTGRTRTATATPVHGQLRALLVAAEVALAVVLLVGAALMVRSFVRLNAIDVGFNPDKVLAVTIGLDAERYPTEAARISLLRQVAKDVDELPGVSGVAISTGLPPTPGTMGLASIHSESGECGGERTPIVSNLVTANYFGLMGIAVAEGRPLRGDDPPNAVVISHALARMCAGAPLVGRRLRLDDSAPWLTVVGIAADVKTRGLTSDEGEIAIYLPFEADPAVLPMVAVMMERRVEARRLVVRAERPTALIADVKRVLWSHDPSQPVLGAVPLAELMADSIRRERFMLMLMTLFSTVALALASAGIFGVLAYTVAQRANEIGIRMALGATRSHVLKLVVGRGLAVTAVGVCAGIAGAFALSRLLAGLLHEVNPRDPAVFIVMPALVFLVALLASWIPTLRALRVDPASALRVE